MMKQEHKAKRFAEKIFQNLYNVDDLAYWSCDCPSSEQSKQLYTFAHKICS